MFAVRNINAKPPSTAGRATRRLRYDSTQSSTVTGIFRKAGYAAATASNNRARSTRSGGSTAKSRVGDDETSKIQVKFSPERVEQVVRPCLHDCLVKLDSYDAITCSQQVSRLAEAIKASVKALGYSSRYKFVVQVHMGESRHQGVEVASRAIWHSASDGMASVTCTYNGMFAVATVYGIYYE